MGHARELFAAYGHGEVFGRSEVVALLGLTPSPALELLRKLATIGVIHPVSGMGKGRYRFVPSGTIA